MVFTVVVTIVDTRGLRIALALFDSALFLAGCGLFLLALPAPWGWTSVFAPLLMLWFLLRVTGIPATEAQSLRTKGAAYRDYQRRTSAFFPLPPRSA